MPYSLGCGARCDFTRRPGLEAQVNVVCHNTKLVRVVLKAYRM